MKRENMLPMIFFSVILAAGCGSSLKLDSQWRDHEIAVDGQHEEWQGQMTYIEEEEMSVGFFNDADYLYISMRTASREIQRRFMALGFTLWFDPDGGQGKEFGIRFPIGMIEMGMAMRQPDEQRDMEAMRENFEKSLANLELHLPGEDEPRLMRVTEAKGIEVGVGDPRQQLIYEIKVPLQKDDAHPFAIEAREDKPIGVGFETAQIDRSELRKQPSPGGMEGGGGLFGGRRPMGGRGRPQMPEQLKLWVSLNLATEHQTASAEVISEK